MSTATQKKKGFTIIELTIYLGLFALLVGGVAASVFSIVESSARNQTKASFQEEGNFLIGKIDWVLSSIRLVNSPAVGSTGGTLSVTKWDSTIGTIIVAQDGTTLTIKKGSAIPIVLNNTNVEVSNLSFTHTYEGGTSPESVTASFTLSARTPNGFLMSRDFTTTTFVRK